MQFMCALAVAGDAGAGADADADGAHLPAAPPALRRTPTAESIAHGDVYVCSFIWAMLCAVNRFDLVECSQLTYSTHPPPTARAVW